jgi:hypothetical protein
VVEGDDVTEGARLRWSSQPTWPFLPKDLHGGSAAQRAGVVLVEPVAVGAALHVGDPVLVGEVPLDGLADAGLEGLGRAPAEFALDLAGVDGVAAVVAGAVGDVGDEAASCRRRRA